MAAVVLCGHAQQSSEMLRAVVARCWDGIDLHTHISGSSSEMKEARLRLGIQLGTYPQLKTCAKSDGGLKHWAYPV